MYYWPTLPGPDCHTWQWEPQSNVSFTLVWNIFGSLFFGKLLNSTKLKGFKAWTVCLRKFHIISIRFKSGQGHSKTLILFFSHVNMNLLVVSFLLHNSSELKFKIGNSWTYFGYLDFLTECRIHGFIIYGKSSRYWSCNEATDDYTATSSRVLLDMKNLNFCLIALNTHVLSKTPLCHFNQG